MSKIYGHRGACGYCVENTMPSFALARKMGADGIEFDVHQTKDGVLIVHHDFDLGRVTRTKGAIDEMTYKDIQNVTFKHDKDHKFHIPTLNEVLAFCIQNHLEMNIEIKAGSEKYPGIEENVLKTIRQSAANNQDMIVSSFDLEALTNLVDLHCEFPLGVLFDSDEFAKMIDFAQKNALKAIHPNVDHLTPATMSLAKQAGLLVNTYTVNVPKRMRQCIEMGCNILITNYPNAAKHIATASSTHAKHPVEPF